MTDTRSTTPPSAGEYQELLQRLDDYKPYQLNGEWFTPPIVAEADDAIRTLIAENEALKAKGHLCPNCGAFTTAQPQGER